MPSPPGRGAQVRLDGTAQAAARGALGLPLAATIEAKRVLEFTGAAADGTTRDGSTHTGAAAADEVLTPGAVAPVTDVGAAFVAWFNSLPTALPATPGVFWNNGGTLAQS